MSNHPDDDAIDLDTLALNASGAKQLIRFATPTEEKRYRELFPVDFNCLPVTVTITGVVEGELVLRYHFWPCALPSGERLALPNDPQTIADVDVGHVDVMQTPRGFELKGRQAGCTQEWLASALAYVQKR